MEDEVLTAFDLLLSELDSEKEHIADEVKKVILKGDFEEEERLKKKFKSIEDFAKDVRRLKEKWENIISGDFEESHEFRIQEETERKKPEEDLPSIFRVLSSSDISPKSNSGDRKRRDLNLGVRREEYKVVILEVLMEFGGSGRINDILDMVFEKLKDRMTEDELERLPSDGEIRWRKNAQWTRYFMVKEGLLKSDSPRGIWEITEEGKRYLSEGGIHGFSRQR